MKWSWLILMGTVAVMRYTSFYTVTHFSQYTLYRIFKHINGGIPGIPTKSSHFLQAFPLTIQRAWGNRPGNPGYGSESRLRLGPMGPTPPGCWKDPQSWDFGATEATGWPPASGDLKHITDDPKHPGDTCQTYQERDIYKYIIWYIKDMVLVWYITDPLDIYIYIFVYLFVHMKHVPKDRPASQKSASQNARRVDRTTLIYDIGW